MLSVLIITGPYSLTSADLDIWRSRCLVNQVRRSALRSFLLLDPAAMHALVDVIAFWQTEEPLPYDYVFWCQVVIEGVRNLPENCCMRDGRKWKKIPCVVLAEGGLLYVEHWLRPVAAPVVEYSPCSNYWNFGQTLRRLEEVVEKYQKQVLACYVRVGILVDYEHGQFRVKWALQRKDPYAENEYYYAPADRRKLASYMTAHREVMGIAYEAQLFEELINDPKTRERHLHRFFEQHPAFLMDAMQGVPISHKPRFASPVHWTPDFVVPAAVATLSGGHTVDIAELKGVHAPLLSGKIHRGFSHNVMAAIDQVRDYDRIIREDRPANRDEVMNTFGYLPKNVRKAVVIGRAPRTQSDLEILRQRMAEQPDVRIVPYDEILVTQQSQI